VQPVPRERAGRPGDPAAEVGEVKRRTTRYADGWREFSRWVRDVRAGRRCECCGECGLHQAAFIDPRKAVLAAPGVLIACPGAVTLAARRCIEHDGEPARYMKRGTIVMLTVAHLNAEGGPCQCDPRCVIPEHVLALCQRCHLRYDGPRHQANARDTRLAPAGEQQALTLPGAERGDAST